ncbi:MAG: phospholipid carrier-dependent glycosyltransferase [Actinomycetaceae bacterium]|nr:phospholipid carrier-dependent glycosyltransferase [Actinomycetaceae bacterium]
MDTTMSDLHDSTEGTTGKSRESTNTPGNTTRESSAKNSMCCPGNNTDNPADKNHDNDGKSRKARRFNKRSQHERVVLTDNESEFDSYDHIPYAISTSESVDLTKDNTQENHFAKAQGITLDTSIPRHKESDASADGADPLQEHHQTRTTDKDIIAGASRQQASSRSKSAQSVSNDSEATDSGSALHDRTQANGRQTHQELAEEEDPASLEADDASGDNHPSQKTPASNTVSDTAKSQCKASWYRQEFSSHWLRKIGWHPAGSLRTLTHFDERIANWTLTIVITIYAAFLRLWQLGVIKKLAFDEVYYVKDGYALSVLGYEAKWKKGDEINEQFAVGDFSGLTTDGSFVVHPPFGKWLMSTGITVFGPDSQFGWRIAVALCSVITVFLVMRIIWLLFDSAMLTGIGGLLLATETLHIGVSRLGLLDAILGMFIIAAFLAFIKDQHQARRFMSVEAGNFTKEYAIKTGTKRRPQKALSFKETFTALTPVRWVWRPWLFVTAICLGLACAVKWSAIYAIAVLGIFLFIREVTLRLRTGARADAAFSHAVVYGGIPAFLQLVPVALITYLLGWLPWFSHPQAWGHGNAAKKGLIAADSWLAPLYDLALYHQSIMEFHVGVTSQHTYQSTPLQWIADLRPTSMVFEKPYGQSGDYIVRAMTALGNPALFWVGLVALVVVVLAAVVIRDWRAGIIMCGYLALWAPWLWYSYVGNRTIFMFYMVILSPFITLAVTYMLGILTGHITPIVEPLGASRQNLAAPRVRVPRFSFVFAVILTTLIIVCALYFLPLATGSEMTISQWQSRMWLKSWI